MATKFGRIDSAESSFEEQTFHKNQTLTSSSLGTNHQIAIKDCKSEGYGTNACTTDDGAILNNRGIHWAFLHTMFYSSGSTKINEDEREKFNSIYHNYNEHSDLKPFHKNKFKEFLCTDLYKFLDDIVDLNDHLELHNLNASDAYRLEKSIISA